MSGPDAVSTSSLTRTALSADSADSSGRLDAFDGVAADVRTPFPLDRDLADDARQHCGLPSSVIHELRTPLTSIHGYAQVLQRNLANPARATNAVGVISRESVKLTEMLALLSELAELESEEPALPTFPIDVRQMIEGIMQDVERRDNGQHPITLEGDGLALGNPHLFSRAVLHVLTNAVRYSESGQPVAVTILTDANTTEVVVCDNGIGVPAGEYAKVFRAYARGSNAKEYGVRGLGLGLYLAREGLRQMGGRIDIEPGPTSGTVVRMRIPRG